MTVQVGVIGTGFGARVVAPVFAATDGCAVVDVVSARDDAGVVALCENTDVDLICVHSPPFLHASHVRRAIATGHAVLCDKPFSLDAEQAQTLLAAAEAAECLHLLNFEFRFDPARVLLHDLVADGAVGRPEHVLWTHLSAGSRQPLRPHGWLFERAPGGGWIGAWGSHAVDAVRWLLGEITAAGARCTVTIGERPDRDGIVRACDAEDAFTAWMTVEGGATVGIDTSFAATVTLPTHVVICGSEGTLEVTNDRRVVVRRADGTKEEIELPARTGDPHAGALGAWAHAIADAVTEGRQITPSFHDGVACARVLDALRSGWDGQSTG